MTKSPLSWHHILLADQSQILQTLKHLRLRNMIVILNCWLERAVGVLIRQAFPLAIYRVSIQDIESLLSPVNFFCRLETRNGSAPLAEKR